jgi:GMP synthase (glutamine-hydrolysing)
MIKIDVVDNGGQWTHREWRVLKYCGVDSTIIPNTTKVQDIKCDGLLLSGGAPRIAWEAPKLGETETYLDQLNIPMLGMCLAHQFIALHYGGEAGPSKVPEFGHAKLHIDVKDDLFDSVPSESQVWESHNDEIKILPPVLFKLAHSTDCEFQAIKHQDKPIYGLQFHPEVEQSEYGSRIIKNFVNICRKQNESLVKQDVGQDSN